MIYTIFIQQLLFGIIALLLTYATGKLIAGFFKIEGNFFFHLFVIYIIGITSIVLIYSIIKAHGRTVNILLLPLIAFLIYYFQKSFTSKFTFNKKEIIREIGWSLLPFLFVFLYQSWFYFDFGNGTLKPLFADYAWYAGFTNPIALWGSENLLLDMNYYFPHFQSFFSPYHYPELWLTSFFNTVTRSGLLNSYYFSVYPLLASVFMLGVMSLFENKIKNYGLLLMIAVFAGFITDITFPLNYNTSNSLGLFAINGQKAAFIFILGLISFIAFNTNHRKLGLIILASIPLFSIIYAPGIWGGILVYLIVTLLFDFKKNIKQSLFIVGYIALIALMFGFYMSVKKPTNLPNEFTLVFSSGIFKGFDGQLTLLNCKRLIANFFTYGIPNVLLHFSSRLVLYLPLLLLLYQPILKRKHEFILLLLVLLSGALTSTLFKPLLNSDQFTSLLGVLFIVFIITLIADFIQQTSSLKLKIMISGICLLLTLLSWISPYNSRAYFSNSEDMQFIKKASEMLPKDEAVVIMTYFSEKEVSNSSLYGWIYNNHITPIMQFSSNNIVFTLANPEMFKKVNGRLSYNDSITFRYKMPINVWRNKNKNDTSIQTFINSYSIKCFYIKPGLDIPDYLMNKPNKTIISSTKGSKFIVINN